MITDLSRDRDANERESYEVRAARTIEAMQRGDDVIYQATVFDGRWVGHPDFLLRVPAITRVDSKGGGLGVDFHYEVADTKLAHSAKASALIQICCYVDQIERIQGVRPEKVYVVTGGAELENHAFRTAEMMAYYRHAKASVSRQRSTTQPMASPNGRSPRTSAIPTRSTTAPSAAGTRTTACDQWWYATTHCPSSPASRATSARCSRARHSTMTALSVLTQPLSWT